MLYLITHTFIHIEEKKMLKSIISSIFDFGKDDRDRELMSFCRSEFKNDAEWAYDSLRRTKRLPEQQFYPSYRW